MTDTIGDAQDLEACIGKTPGGVNLKVIDHLDAGAIRWIAASPLMFAGFVVELGLAVTLGGGQRGFAHASDAAHLILPVAALDQPHVACVGAGVGTMFLVPGIHEILRVNGHVSAIEGDCITIAVRECFMQCAKALMRSDFWNAVPDSATPHDVTDFLAASRFMALATCDAQGNVDISPRGDPAGMLIRLKQNMVVYADRPGNRRVDSFHNILSQPQIAAFVLIPGSGSMVHFSGMARISTDDTLRASFIIKDKMPALVTSVEPAHLSLAGSAALAHARLWPAADAPADINPAAMFAAHVKLNKTKGFTARMVRAAVSVPGMMQKSLDLEYKHKLY